MHQAEMEKRYKVVCLGESSTGKTSLTLRFVKKEFVTAVEPTIGAGFLVGRVNNTTFELWDTAGSERYRSLAPMYYRNSRAAIVAYDITNADSFQKVEYWINELKATGLNIVICLVGSKLDLVEENAEARAVSKEIATQFAHDRDLGFFETSAKTGENVSRVFEWLDAMVRELDALAPSAPPPSVRQQADSQSVNLPSAAAVAANRNSCC